MKITKDDRHAFARGLLNHRWSFRVRLESGSSNLFTLPLSLWRRAFLFSSANKVNPVPNIAGGIRLLQIFIEPRDGLLQPIDLMLGFDEHMAFAGIDDQLCRYA